MNERSTKTTKSKKSMDVVNPKDALLEALKEYPLPQKIYI